MKELIFVASLLSVTSFQSAHAQALAIYGKGAVVGYARLESDESINGCAYRRLSGKIEHISRNTNGVRVDGFALSQPNSSIREYVNVSFERLPRAPAFDLNQRLTEGVGRKVEIVLYGCGASGAVQILDEIVFR